MKGSGTFTLRLRVMAKDKYIYVELKGENKTTFEGNFKKSQFSLTLIIQYSRKC
jgi:hypothetical protein